MPLSLAVLAVLPVAGQHIPLLHILDEAFNLHEGLKIVPVYFYMQTTSYSLNFCFCVAIVTCIICTKALLVLFTGAGNHQSSPTNLKKP